MKLITPFSNVSARTVWYINIGWFILMTGYWFLSSTKETNLFPTPNQVFTGLIKLYGEGLIVHLASSLALCAKAIGISIVLSLSLVYLSTLPIIKPIAAFISKFRYLPLVGISFYITMILTDARAIQVWILVIFMSTFLITSLLAMIREIPIEEFDHARALGYSQWNILLEVVIKGRIDYVIEIVRQNLAIVWMMLVTVESIVVASGGLGLLIKNSDKFMNHGRIVALQLIILLVGLLLDLFLIWLRKMLFRYSTI